MPDGQNLVLENGKLNPAATLGRVVKGKDAAGNPFDYTITPDDWYDLAYSPSLRQEYNLNVAKGNDNSNIYFSMGYLDNKGILQNTDFKRFTSRLKADWAAKDWLNFNTNISYTNSRMHDVGGEGDASNSGSIFALVNGIAPIYPAYLRDGKGNIMMDNMGFPRYDYGQGVLPMNRPFLSMSNPLSDNALNYSGEQVHTLNANVGADVDLGKGFKFVTNNTLYLISSRGESLANPYYGQSAESSKGQVAVGSDLNVRHNFQQLLNYSRTFGGVHNVEALVGHEYYRSKSYSLSGTRTNLVDNQNHELGGGLEMVRPLQALVSTTPKDGLHVPTIASSNATLLQLRSVAMLLLASIPITAGATSGASLVRGSSLRKPSSRRSGWTNSSSRCLMVNKVMMVSAITSTPRLILSRTATVAWHSCHACWVMRTFLGRKTVTSTWVLNSLSSRVA